MVTYNKYRLYCPSYVYVCEQISTYNLVFLHVYVFEQTLIVLLFACLMFMRTNKYILFKKTYLLCYFIFENIMLRWFLMATSNYKL